MEEFNIWFFYCHAQHLYWKMVKGHDAMVMEETKSLLADLISNGRGQILDSILAFLCASLWHPNLTTVLDYFLGGQRVCNFCR